MLKKYVGDKAFYKMVLMIVIPITIQNFITNFVNMLDILMVGSLGTEQMSGVSIVNQIVFVFNLTIFGAVSGAGIFTSQFYGKSDDDGIRYTIRYKFIILTIISLIGIGIFLIYGDFLINMFLHDSENSGSDIIKTFIFAKDYLKICVIGFVPFAFAQLYASTLRETGETFVPMIVGFVAVIVNCLLNYLLIFGKLGFPQLGVRGAAIATTTSRFVECFVIMAYTIAKKEKHTYFKGVYKSLYMPKKVFLDMTLKGSPILFNECLWSLGISLLGVSYSFHGLDVVAGHSISSTITNLLIIAFTSMGVGIGIVVGKYLGANRFEEAVDVDRKMIAFSVFISIWIGILSIILAYIVPGFYNVSEASKELATYFIIVMGIYMPLEALLTGIYFTLRSGGKTYITFLFDSVFMCLVQVPVAMCLGLYTDLSIFVIFPIVQFVNIIKCTIGWILLVKKTWVNNIVEETQSV